ncbi:hypothetical protein LJR013_003209 [Pseudarthrobacter oxydans]|uniref:hypothetical protein n=1 Tax=Pseudarthrobacter oxydans TaxID=1671 RepID=UPI003ECF55FC
MTRKFAQYAVPLAGLSAWAMPFDRTAGARVPTVPDNPGIIHAVRPRLTEMGLREPSFIEDTYMYRAALCGAKVKIIMPNTFKADEEGACQKCANEDPAPSLIRPGTPASKMFTMGDIWGPRTWRRKSVRKQQKAAK